MIISNNYFDIVFTENNKFFIDTSKKSNKKSTPSPLSLLEKIKKIVEGNFLYDKNKNDQYSDLDEKELFDILEKKSNEIFQNSQSSKFPVLSDKKKIEKVYLSIHNRLTPKLFDLPKDVLSKIASHLPIVDMLTFEQLSRQASTQTTKPITLRAQEAGYEGWDYEGAKEYLKELFYELKYFCKTFIPKEKWVLNDKMKIDQEKTLRNLLNDKENLLFYLVHSSRWALGGKSFHKSYLGIVAVRNHPSPEQAKIYFKKLYKLFLIQAKNLLHNNSHEENLRLLYKPYPHDPKAVDMYRQYDPQEYAFEFSRELWDLFLDTKYQQNSDRNIPGKSDLV